MANLENIENVESDLEAKESEVSEANEQLQEVNDRLSQIESAIHELSDDSAVSESLESNNLENAQSEKEAIEQRRSELAGDIERALGEIEEMQDDNEHSSQAVQELASIGEDVSEAQGIVEGRRSELDKARSLAERLLDQLRS